MISHGSHEEAHGRYLMALSLMALGWLEIPFRPRSILGIPSNRVVELGMHVQL